MLILGLLRIELIQAVVLFHDLQQLLLAVKVGINALLRTELLQRWQLDHLDAWSSPGQSLQHVIDALASGQAVVERTGIVQQLGPQPLSRRTHMPEIAAFALVGEVALPCLGEVESVEPSSQKCEMGNTEVFSPEVLCGSTWWPPSWTSLMNFCFRYAVENGHVDPLRQESALSIHIIPGRGMLTLRHIHEM